jgi:hypothetical protein
MFQCDRCGSSYSSMHTVGIENCPRCLLRDKTVSPLSLKIFDLPDRVEAETTRVDAAGAAVDTVSSGSESAAIASEGESTA